jgi:hypothetical protein
MVDFFGGAAGINGGNVTITSPIPSGKPELLTGTVTTAITIINATTPVIGTTKQLTIRCPEDSTHNLEFQFGTEGWLELSIGDSYEGNINCGVGGNDLMVRGKSNASAIYEVIATY